MNTDDQSLMSAFGISGFGSKSGVKKDLNKPTRAPEVVIGANNSVSSSSSSEVGSDATTALNLSTEDSNEKNNKSKRQKTANNNLEAKSISSNIPSSLNTLVSYGNDDSDSDSDFGPLPASSTTDVPAPASVPTPPAHVHTPTPTATTEDSESEDEFGPMPATAAAALAPRVDTDDSADEYSSDDESVSFPPSSAPAAPAASSSLRSFSAARFVPLHRLSVTAVAAASSSLLTAGTDGCLHLNVASGSPPRLQQVRSSEPVEGQSIRCIRVHPVSGAVLVLLSGPRPVLLDGDLRETAVCAQGYPYIADPRKRAGHTAACNDGQWHPSASSSEFITASDDGTVRVWNVSGCDKASVGVIRPPASFATRAVHSSSISSARRGQDPAVAPAVARSNVDAVLSCCYSPCGTRIAMACASGTVLVYKHGRGLHAVGRPPEHRWEVGPGLRQVAFCPGHGGNSDQLLVLRAAPGTGWVMEVRGLQGAVVAEVAVAAGDDGHDGQLCLSEDKRWVAAAVGVRHGGQRGSGGGAGAGRLEEEAEWSRAVAEVAAGLAGAGAEAAASSPAIKVEEGAEHVAVPVVQAEPKTWVQAAGVGGGGSGPGVAGRGAVMVVEVGAWARPVRVELPVPAVAVSWAGGALCVGLTDGSVAVMGDAGTEENALVQAAKNARNTKRQGEEEEVWAGTHVDLDNIYCGDEAGRLTVHGKAPKRKRGEGGKAGAEAPSGSARGHVNNTSVTHHYMKQILGFDKNK